MAASTAKITPANPQPKPPVAYSIPEAARAGRQRCLTFATLCRPRLRLRSRIFAGISGTEIPNDAG